MIPYLIFSFIDLVPRILLPQFINRETDILSGIQKILLEGGEYWFLYSLFLIFLFMPLGYKYIIKNENKYLKYIFFAIIIIIDCFNLPNIFLIDKTIKYLKFFIIGCIIKENFEKSKQIKNFISEKRMQNILVISICFILMLIYAVFKEKISISIITTIISLVGCMFWFEIGILIKRNLRTKYFIKLCGKYSLQLYFFNGYFLVISRTLIINILNIKIPIIIIIFNTLFDIILPLIIIDKILMRFKVLRFISHCNEIRVEKNN